METPVYCNNAGLLPGSRTKHAHTHMHHMLAVTDISHTPSGKRVRSGTRSVLTSLRTPFKDGSTIMFLLQESRRDSFTKRMGSWTSLRHHSCRSLWWHHVSYTFTDVRVCFQFSTAYLEANSTRTRLNFNTIYFVQPKFKHHKCWTNILLSMLKANKPASFLASGTI